jgi:putative glutamine amidotransferase
VIEAYESTEDDWWVMGVQFHPENQSASALDLQVFEMFVAGCKEQVGREEPAILSLENARRAA